MECLRFKLDEEWYDLPEGMKKFHSLRDWVASKLKGEGRVLLGIMNGDDSVRQEEIDEWGERPLDEFETLVFFSAEPMELACRTCGDLIEFMDELERRGEWASEFIDSGDQENIALGFKECVEGWDLVLQGYRNLIQLAKMDSSTVEIGGQSLTVVAIRMKELFLKMADEFTEKNMSVLKEMISDDLGLYIDPMRKALEEVQEKLEGAIL